MNTRLKSGFAFVAAISILVALLAIFLWPGKVELENSETAEIPNNRQMDFPHPLVEPTDFYAQSEFEGTIPDVPLPEYATHRTDHEFVLNIRRMLEGDLLADSWFSSVQQFVTEDQLEKARTMAKEYDARLRELRRERAEILEHAGVTIKDPTEALRENDLRFCQLVVEVKKLFADEILVVEQRKLIRDKFRQLQIARASREANKKPAKPPAKVR